MVEDEFIDIVYARVSHKDKKESEESYTQDIEHQISAILHKFKLTNPLILKEKGTAYFLENVKNRTEFIKILDLCFENKGITDIFTQNFEKKKIRLYIWDLNRIMRNLKFNLLFSVLATIHDVQIYSYSDRDLHKHNSSEEDYEGEFIKLLLAVLSAKRAEDYSRDVSKNTRKAFAKGKSSSYSVKDGKKVGRKFKDLEGNLKVMTQEEEEKMYDFIVKKIIYYQSRNIGGFYPLLVKEIQSTYGIDVSRAYLSMVKKRLE